ncbi:unnamed protein product, partial [Closterium sp. Naga37s-1]
IICIANDLYAPALRPLRLVAEVHVFQPPTTNRVVSRLRHICEAEGFEADVRGLTALAAQTDGDIRACLNTLQFLHRANRALRASEVAEQVVGRKDTTKGLMDVWNEVFFPTSLRSVPKPLSSAPRPPSAAAAASPSLHSSSSSSSPSQPASHYSRFDSLISQQGGTSDTLLDGIHDNLLHAALSDVSLRKTSSSLHWLVCADQWHHRAMASQQFALLAFETCAMYAIRATMGAADRHPLEWPKAHARYRSQHTVRRETVEAWRGAMLPAIARTSPLRSLVPDLVSPLLSVISATPIRPVAGQLLTPWEKAALAQLVATMLDYGLSYRHAHQLPWHRRTGFPGGAAGGGVEGGFGGGDAHLTGPVLDPPLTEFVVFDVRCCDVTMAAALGVDTEGLRPPPYVMSISAAVRQLIGREIELERIRRDSVRVKSASTPNAAAPQPPPALPRPPPAPAPNLPPTAPAVSHQQPQSASLPQPANGVPQSSKGKGTQTGDGKAKKNGIPMEGKSVKPQDASGSAQQGSDAKPAKVKEMQRRPFRGFTR